MSVHGCDRDQLLNLALEKQAVGRVYRLGQERPVTVSVLVRFLFLCLWCHHVQLVKKSL